MGKGRRPCCDKAGVKKGPWSQAEDFKLISFIGKHGHSNWRALPKLAGLARCGKSCRLRWVNYLRPDLKRGNFTLQEEEAIIKLHQELGNKWSKIASKFPGRTDNEIKNVWNTHLKKRIKAKESDKNSSESCNSLQTSTTTDESLDKNMGQNLIHQTNTMDDTNEHSSSSSTSYTSQPPFPEHEKEDLGPIFDSLGVPNPIMLENNSSIDELIEIPFEPNLDLWDLLEGYQCDSTDVSDVNFDEVDNALLQVAPEIDKLSNNTNSNVNNNKGEDKGSWWWLVYLENELGLEHNEAKSTESN
ncbi:hypothetical protein RND81_03G227500 [Saponaria officinalis]|uniref:Uncharacterized protein n=1 Tax=Saponaria officinalis TaxID=3572 RepID=A0AAW1M9P9_SAPOF